MCLSVHDFRKVYQMNKRDGNLASDHLQAIMELGPDTMPKVYLSCTDQRALDVVSLDELKKYATKEK